MDIIVNVKIFEDLYNSNVSRFKLKLKHFWFQEQLNKISRIHRRYLHLFKNWLKMSIKYIYKTNIFTNMYGTSYWCLISFNSTLK